MLRQISSPIGKHLENNASCNDFNFYKSCSLAAIKRIHRLGSTCDTSFARIWVPESWRLSWKFPQIVSMNKERLDNGYKLCTFIKQLFATVQLSSKTYLGYKHARPKAQRLATDSSSSFDEWLQSNPVPRRNQVQDLEPQSPLFFASSNPNAKLVLVLDFYVLAPWN